MNCYMYILQCANGAYYTGSTKDLETRLKQHQNGEGANFTKKHLPVKLVYYEVFERIDEAFYREKQVQGWSRMKEASSNKQRIWTVPEQYKKLAQRDVISTSSMTRCFDELSNQK